MTELVVERTLVAGIARGRALVLDEPLSFWGGLDAETGRITDQHHPQVGRSIAGTVLVMAVGRGSSSASSVLAEAIRLGTAPVALVMLESDEIVVLGAIVADELYGITVPVVLVSADTMAAIVTGQSLTIRAG